MIAILLFALQSTRYLRNLGELYMEAKSSWKGLGVLHFSVNDLQFFFI